MDLAKASSVADEFGAPVPTLVSAIADGPGQSISTVLSTEPLEVDDALDAMPEAHALGMSSSGRGVVSPAGIGKESGATAPAAIYVSTLGNDLWTGQLAAPNPKANDGPVKTLKAAQTIARSRLAAMAGGATRQAVRVLIQPGVYQLTAPLAITTADSGTTTFPMSYEAVTAGTVTISGGVTLTQRTAASGSQPAQFNVPGAAGTNWNGGGQLFVNGRRATLARQPNAGQYYFIQKPTVLPTEPAGAQGRQAFVPSADAMTWINGLPSEERSRAVVNVMQAWTSSQHHLATSAPAGSIQVTPSSNWTFLVSGASQRYYIENVPSALDAPGEFLWDASGVNYIPATNEVGKPLSVVMPVLANLVSVTGDIDRSAWVQNVSFKGLTFAHTRYQTPGTGFLDHQAAVYVGAAIQVDAAKNIVIDNCTVTGVAGYGVWFRRAVSNSSVTNSTLTDLGAGGVQLGQPSQSTKDVLQTGYNSAIGNRIGNTGKIFPGAVGVWVGNTFNNLVANNLVYDTTYSGISVGWTWGYGAATSGNNAVTGNLLVNIGQGMMSDMGGIYTVGISPGTTIAGNVIREVRGYPSYGAGAFGIYQDSGSSETVISDNIVLGVDNGTYQLGVGRNNHVSSNLLGLGDRFEVTVNTSDPSNTPLTFSDNLLVSNTIQPLKNFATNPDTVFSNVRISSIYAPGTASLAMCGSGCSAQAASLSLTTNPRGVAVVGADSATITRVALTAALAGPPQLADASTIVKVATAPPPAALAPPIAAWIDIANAPLGTQPMGLWYSTPGINAATTVASNSAAPNGRCLRYNDSASNGNSYDPHTYAEMLHASGTTTGTFFLLIDSKTNFAHQWRDKALPVKTGPYLTVTAAGVSVAGKVVAPVTVGEWMKFSVTARLANPGGTWSLQVTDAKGQTTIVNNLPFAQSGWASLNWWGFISNARVDSSFCLHSLGATNTL